MVQVLYHLEVSVLFDQLFLSETGKTDRQLDVITASLASEDEALAVFLVTDVRTGNHCA